MRDRAGTIHQGDLNSEERQAETLNATTAVTAASSRETRPILTSLHPVSRSRTLWSERCPHAANFAYGSAKVSTVLVAITVTYCLPFTWYVIGLDRIGRGA